MKGAEEGRGNGLVRMGVAPGADGHKRGPETQGSISEDMPVEPQLQKWYNPRRFDGCCGWRRCGHAGARVHLESWMAGQYQQECEARNRG